MTTFRNFLFIALLIAAGCLSLCHTYQYHISPGSGDQDRELYNFAATLHGETPYQDYGWGHGPLMPYYYALFMKFLGVNIGSVLLGKMVLTIVAGVFLALALSFFVPSLLAFAAALWFWAYFPEFEFTYNHIGGIAMLMAVMHALLAYLKTGRMPYLYWGLLWIFTLAFIKINLGFSALAAFLIAVYWIDKDIHRPMNGQRRKFYLLGLIVLPALVLAVDLALIQGLSLAEIRQCFPYLKSDHPCHKPLEKCFVLWVRDIFSTLTSAWPHRLFGALVLVALGYDISLFWKKKILPRLSRQIVLAVKILFLFYLFTLHEYLTSVVMDRIIWAKPFSMMLSFILIGTAVRHIHKFIQLPVVALLVFFAASHLHEQMDLLLVRKLPDQLDAPPRGQAILGGNPRQWINTVEQAPVMVDKRKTPDGPGTTARKS